ncbi:hypothetical protein PF005_g20997 [Phytophthora fragariae]|uniref:Uncharacterized protein n=1 Tax=Phytophthora fragariae TaxID=53985 RepID=A0A6A3E5J6_9STRA|nr:hypothetical protein PF003_g19835 [Phytophthora fragariae]KAE8927517.1 hypothetical protein PF009_g22316 [Phytophthora fragariae]KAE8965675.1 hypothetical protein PF011_g28203 [Phytophthora fragariae]KAE9085469.1 hypothetical protein PF007_g21134 [Phytophthora fragariae]KAE9186064.1 hypothetical protein PF005_g20997 [Phytophthora fragariae]
MAKRANDSLHRSGAPTAASHRGNTSKRARAESEARSKSMSLPSTAASESGCRSLSLPSSGESEASCRYLLLPTDGVVTTSCSLSSSRNLRAQWIHQLNGRLAILLILDQLFLRVDARPSTSTHTLSSVAQTLLIVLADEPARCSSERRKIHRSIEWRGFALTPEMEPSEFRNTFRVTPSAFASLLHTLQPAVEKKTTNFGEPLSVSVRLAVFLYFIGHGCSLQQLRSQFGIGKSTASGIVREVSKAVVGLMQSYVVFPARRDELLKLSMEFEDGYGIPGCVGALDGCHIPIVQPSRPNSKKVFNRKGFYSLNMSAVVDRHRRFLDVDVRWPGSVGANRVFSNSAVGRMHDLILSEAGGAQGAGFLQTGLEEYRKIPFFLLADSAYANSTHVVTTYEIAEADKDVVVSKLNRKLAGMRYSVKCAFGVAKSRWRVLAKPIETSRTNLEDVPTLVSAVCILHNFVIDKSDGVWDARAEARRRAFYFANYLTLTNEEACPDSQTSQEKTRNAIFSWMRFRDSVRSS